jgi:hypothetical protein
LLKRASLCFLLNNKKRTASAKKWTDIINSGVVNTTKTVSNTSKKEEKRDEQIDFNVL